MKRGTSNDSVKFNKKNILTSDITVSSVDYRDDALDIEQDSKNSIISEEDSAFEDQTPAHKKVH